MLDYRMLTFITLCDVMNYRVTAELLNMTQPAVTQHIHFLENEYGCKLFIYNGKTLTRTKDADILLEYARSARHNEKEIKEKLLIGGMRELRIGATKSIGEFIIKDKIKKIASGYNGDITFIVENTQSLLNLLNHNELDLALVEGHFDKTRYAYSLFRMERLVGICCKTHPFANGKIKMDEMLRETIIVREKGSGTRDVFEQCLIEHNFNLDSFKRRLSISEFGIIKDLVRSGEGISFVYEEVIKNDDDIGTFEIKDCHIARELNYVYLKNTNSDELIKAFENDE